MLPFPLPLLQLLLFLLLLPSFLLHLRLHLSTPARLIVYEYPLRLLPPVLRELLRLQLGAVDGPFVLPDEQHARVSDGFVEPLAMLFIHKFGLRFLEAVEGVGRLWILGLVGMDQEGFGAVTFLDVGVGNAGLEVEHSVCVETEGFQDTCDLGILKVQPLASCDSDSW